MTETIPNEIIDINDFLERLPTSDTMWVKCKRLFYTNSLMLQNANQSAKQLTERQQPTDNTINPMDPPICRICRCGISVGDLVTNTCQCKGTMGYVHWKCIRDWRMYTRSNSCEVCRKRFLFRYPEAEIGLASSPLVKNLVGILRSVLVFGSTCLLTKVIIKEFLNLLDLVQENKLVQVDMVPSLGMMTAVFVMIFVDWTVHEIMGIVDTVYDMLDDYYSTLND